MRITGGEWRSRVLQVPKDSDITRPTMDQTRQAIFNILNSASWAEKPNGQPLVMGATVLDVFAGSGAYGFEALSRDASHVTFIDKDRQAVEVIQKNSELLKCTTQVKTLRSDAHTVGANPGEPVTLCFIDPPYTDMSWPDVLVHLKQRQWINENTLIILETNSKTMREAAELAGPVLDIHDQRQYGKSLVIFSAIKD
jgi:16S rRNA (guanine966-N2)-methyltransferase